MNWEQREAMRFFMGVYRDLPKLATLERENVTFPREHYLHLSTVADDMVAFTENAGKGERDRQTRGLSLGSTSSGSQR